MITILRPFHIDSPALVRRATAWWSLLDAMTLAPPEATLLVETSGTDAAWIERVTQEWIHDWKAGYRLQHDAWPEWTEARLTGPGDRALVRIKRTIRREET